MAKKIKFSIDHLVDNNFDNFAIEMVNKYPLVVEVRVDKVRCSKLTYGKYQNAVNY